VPAGLSTANFNAGGAALHGAEGHRRQCSSTLNAQEIAISWRFRCSGWGGVWFGVLWRCVGFSDLRLRPLISSVGLQRAWPSVKPKESVRMSVAFSVLLACALGAPRRGGHMRPIRSRSKTEQPQIQAPAAGKLQAVEAQFKQLADQQSGAGAAAAQYRSATAQQVGCAGRRCAANGRKLPRRAGGHPSPARAMPQHSPSSHLPLNLTATAPPTTPLPGAQPCVFGVARSTPCALFFGGDIYLRLPIRGYPQYYRRISPGRVRYRLSLQRPHLKFNSKNTSPSTP